MNFLKVRELLQHELGANDYIAEVTQDIQASKQLSDEVRQTLLSYIDNPTQEIDCKLVKEASQILREEVFEVDDQLPYAERAAAELRGKYLNVIRNKVNARSQYPQKELTFQNREEVAETLAFGDDLIDFLISKGIHSVDPVTLWREVSKLEEIGLLLTMAKISKVTNISPFTPEQQQKIISKLQGGGLHDFIPQLTALGGRINHLDIECHLQKLLKENKQLKSQASQLLSEREKFLQEIEALKESN